MLRVSCLSPTYNRAPHHLGLVEEAIESFLRQDYPNKELIVLNDTPGQTLRYDHPEVRLVNTPFRCGTLGEKRNLMTALSSGELICPWDDDDIHLPWRLSRSVALLGDDDYYNPHAYWLIDTRGLHHDHLLSWCHGSTIYRKSTLEQLGGYSNQSLGEDIHVDANFLTRKVAQRPPLPLKEWFYIYRWGISPNHLSSQGETNYAEIGKQPIVAGEFTLRPHWEQDYTAMTRDYAFALTMID